MRSGEPGLLFVAYELVYRAFHWRQWKEHQRYVQELNAWLDGTGPEPQYPRTQ
jgi:hypothetical protein